MKNFDSLQEAQQECRYKENPADPSVLYVPMHDECNLDLYTESKILRNGYYHQIDFTTLKF